MSDAAAPEMYREVDSDWVGTSRRNEIFAAWNCAFKFFFETIGVAKNGKIEWKVCCEERRVKMPSKFLFHKNSSRPIQILVL
jgi:hypothetical protein